MPMATSFPARLENGTWYELNDLSTRSIELTEVHRRNAASEELLHQRNRHKEHILRKTKLDLNDDDRMSSCTDY
jgi:hypothetical protein